MSFISTPSSFNFGGGGSGYTAQQQNGEGLRPVSDHRGPLRHFLVGTPPRIRASIRHLQALRYVEYTRWTDLLPIDPEQGLIVRPTARERYAYLELAPWQD